jgi:hypothetical protein
MRPDECRSQVRPDERSQVRKAEHPQMRTDEHSQVRSDECQQMRSGRSRSQVRPGERQMRPDVIFRSAQRARAVEPRLEEERAERFKSPTTRAVGSAAGQRSSERPSHGVHPRGLFVARHPRLQSSSGPWRLVVAAERLKSLEKKTPVSNGSWQLPGFRHFPRTGCPAGDWWGNSIWRQN